MRWPPWRSKPTDDRSAYTDATVRAILASASGEDAGTKAAATAAVQSAVGLIARSMSVATTDHRIAGAALTPTVLYQCAAALALHGEDAYLIRVGPAGRVSLTRASSWDVHTAGDDLSWRYRLVIPGPDTTSTVDVPGAQVFHPRLNPAPEHPHRGRGMLEVAGLTGRLLGALEASLADEAAAPSGNVLPAPLDHLGTAGLTDLKNDLAALKGRTSIVPSMADRWGEGGGRMVGRDWQPQRIGADPPATLAALRGDAHQAVLAAFGVPPSLVIQGAGAAPVRESFRIFLHTTLQPLSLLLGAEASAKFGAPPVKLDLDNLFASDVQGRARAFQSMVGGGMDTDKAAALSGLMEHDD